MSVWTIVGVVVAVLAVIAVAGLVALFVLRGLADHPARFRVKREIPADQIDDYVAKRASFGIVVVESTPLSRKEVWERLTSQAYLSTLPFLTGPTWAKVNTEPDTGEVGIEVGEFRSMSGTILSVSQRVMSVDENRSWTLVGTGLSLPWAIDSFVERWTLTEGERGRLNVRWEIAGSPRWVGWLPWRWGIPLARPVLAFVLRHALRLKPFRRPSADSAR